MRRDGLKTFENALLDVLVEIKQELVGIKEQLNQGKVINITNNTTEVKSPEKLFKDLDRIARMNKE